ncbi:RNA-directed DNA polymerase, eukaryota [Tanacetum coccineum]
MWSNHTPILLYAMKPDFGPSPLKFYNSWLNRDGFDDLIKSTWSTLEAPNDCRILRSRDKLRCIKTAIKQWHSNTKNNDRTLKQVALYDIKDIEKKIDDGSASSSNRDKRIKLLQDIDKLDKLVALDLIQKAHIKWDIEGDENSKFFHGMINNKRRSQAITGILHDEVWISDPLLIKEAFLKYYKEKFQAHNSQVVFSPMIHSTSLTSLDRDSLETNFSLDEIKTAFWDRDSNKAPGPDGSMPQGANSSFSRLFRRLETLSLLKISAPFLLLEFITRSLPNVLLSGSLKSSSGKKKEEKDVNFQACLQSSRASILINGSPTSELSIKRGLQKGDPLSPFLFILAMEGLPGVMSNAVNSDLIRGIKLGSSDITLSHLFYAHDVIITFEWNSGDLENIIRVLHVFHLASGLKINI